MKFKPATAIEIAHESLLLNSLKLVPHLLATQLQSVDDFDSFVEEHLLEIREDLGIVIQEGIEIKTPPAILNVYREALKQLPRFTPPELELPEASCGVLLSDGDGNSHIADLVIQLTVPDFRVGVTNSDSHRSRESMKLENAVEAWYRLKPIEVVVEAFPADVPLGQIIARLGGARRQYTVVVVERREIFDALSSAWDVVLIEGGEVTDYELELLQKTPSYRLDRAIVGFPA